MELFALNSRILCLLYSSPSEIFYLLQVLCEVEINIFWSCWLKLIVLHSSDLQSFLLRVAIALHGNACLSLGCPIHIGSKKVLYDLLAVESALPPLSGQHVCSTGRLQNIFCSADLECWHRFLSCDLRQQVVFYVACFHYVVKLLSN